MSDVPIGYKQTEVGVIPEDWEIKHLGAFCEISAGRDLVKEEFADEPDHRHKFPIYSNSVKGEGLYGYSKSCQYGPDKITVTARGDIGHALYRSTSFCAIGRLLVLSSAHSCDLRFVTEFINHYVDFAIESTGVPQLTAPQISAYTVALPPTKAEQVAIAEALSDADAFIESLEQLLAKKRQLKQGAMQELLTGNKRLPGFNVEWEVKRVGELGEVVTGGTPATEVKEHWGEEYPWITPTDVSSQRDMFTSERGLTPKGLSTIRALPADSLLVTCIASIGKNAILKTEGGCNQQINAIILDGNNSAEFLYYLFEVSKQYLLANAGKTATSIISKATFRDLTFTVPYLDEQTAIAAILSDMDTEITALEDKLAKARHLKQGMMQELLTGRTRLV